jgi:hypothetical protein
MISYRDFAPQRLQQSGIAESIGLKAPTYQALEDALTAANTWIEAEQVKVVSIETVVLPNVWTEGGTSDIELGTMSGWANWYQFIRVWYSQ